MLPRQKWEEDDPGCIYRVTSKKLEAFLTIPLTKITNLVGGGALIKEGLFALIGPSAVHCHDSGAPI